MSLKDNLDQLKIEDGNIDILNDDCLRLIFEYLPMKEKLVIELVSKRWNQIVKLSWRQVNCINLKDLLPGPKDQFIPPARLKNTIFIRNIFKRCTSSTYKLFLDTEYVQKLVYAEFLKDLKKYGVNLNLTHLILVDYEIFYDENTLNQLFDCFPNLSRISFEGVCVHGDIYSNLKPDRIKEFILGDNCNLEKKYLYRFVLNLNHLDKIKIKGDFYFTMDVIKALNINKSENIVEFDLHNGITCGERESNLNESSLIVEEDEKLAIEYLSEILFRQKNLRKLKLICVLGDKKIIDRLAKDTLEDLTLDFYKIKPSLLSLYTFRDFKNLTRFTGCYNNITDETFKMISECFNLKYLKIEYYGAINCTPSMDYLRKLENLEYFKLNCYDVFPVFAVSDNILRGLSQCKNIRYLELCNSRFTNLGLESISFLPRLINFNVNYDTSEIKNKADLKEIMVTDQNFREFFNKMLHLRQLSISYCAKVTNDMIKLAGEIKESRKDKHLLEIQVHESCKNIVINELKNVSPLIKVTQICDETDYRNCY